MISLIVILVALYVGYFHLYPSYMRNLEDKATYAGKTLFDFIVDKPDENGTLSLLEYKGKKAYLVVNVASQCGLTDKNYAGLQELYDKYNKQGLEILAFPCNNFGGQEPGSNEDILVYARETKHASFPVLGKLECDNGDMTHPLYKYLKSSIDGGILGSGLKWNFAKFLVDANGVPVQRYLPIKNPSDLEKDIEELLSK